MFLKDFTRRQSAALISVCVMSLVGQNVSATVTSWTNAAGGTWQSSSNWDAGVPTIGFDSIINVPSNFTIAFGGNAAADSLSISQGSVALALNTSELQVGTLNLSGGSLTLNSLISGTAVVGQMGVTSAINWTNGSLTILGGTFKPPQQTLTYAFSGPAQSYIGAFAISGAAGSSSRPTLDLTNGGTVALTGASYSNGSIFIGVGGGKGGVNVTGTKSILAPASSGNLYVGFGGTSNGTFCGGDGQIAVSTGGQVGGTQQAYVGGAGGVGQVTVDGSGSGFGTTSETIWIGESTNLQSGSTYASVGTVSATNAASITASEFLVGSDNGFGTLSIDGTGTKVTALYANDFGLNGGSGVLSVSNHATATLGTSIKLGLGGGSGTIMFSNGGGTLTTQALYADPNQIVGAGTIISNGIVCDGSLNFDASHGASQTTTFGSSTLKLNITSTIGTIGVGWLGTGTLNMTGGVKVASQFGEIGTNTGSKGNAYVDGSGTVWTVNNAISVGDDYGVGSLTITGGAQVVPYQITISDSGTSGIAIVDGLNSSLAATESLYVASGGTLKLQNGAAASAIETNIGTQYGVGTLAFGAGSGTLTTQGFSAGPSEVTGVGTIYTNGLVTDGTMTFDSTHGLNQTLNFGSSTLHLNLSGSVVTELGVGFLGSGTMSIKDGLTVTSHGGFLGVDSGSVGVGTVDGSGTSWNSSGYTLALGQSAAVGSLTISNGGSVRSSTGYVGYESGKASLTVIGANSFYSNTGSLLVGYYRAQSFNGYAGMGTVALINGGQVINSGDIYIGYLGGEGTLTIGSANGSDSVGSGIKGANLYLDSLSNGDGAVTDAGGTISINKLGTLLLSGTAYTYTNPSNTSATLINLAGGTLEAAAISLASASHLNWSSGTLWLNGGNSTTNGMLAVPLNGVLKGSGNIAGAVSSIGTIAPGTDSSTGTLSISGALTMGTANASGVLTEKLNFTTWSADVLNVAGGVALANAQLNLTTLNATTGTLSPSKTFLILINNSTQPINGTFASLTPPLSAGYQYVINYQFNGTALNGIGNGNDVAITFYSVPEPSTILSALGVISLLRRSGRRRIKKRGHHRSPLK